MVSFSFISAFGQRGLPEMRAEILLKIETYKARHPANEGPQNPLYGSYAWELEEALELASNMHSASAEESYLMLIKILKAALIRLDLSFDPKKTRKSKPPELPKEFKRGNNPIIDPGQIKDATVRADYEKRLAEYRVPIEVTSEQTRLRYLVFTIARHFEMTLPKEPVELRRKIQEKVLKEVEGIKLSAEDQNRLSKSLKVPEPIDK